MRWLTTDWPNRSRSLDLWNEMDRFFEDVTRALPVYDERRFDSQWDIQEEKDHFYLSVDMPGMRKEDINIEMRDQVLTITGERKRHSRMNGKNKAEESDVRRFVRSFTLPNTVDADKIEAQYENGVLEVYLPKTQAAQPRRIEIQSNRGGFFNKLLGSKKDESEMKDVTQSQ